MDGSDALEAHLTATCNRVLAGVRRLVPASRLVGLLLGGGYGRGEGGVLRTPLGDQPYNDLEFYVFVRGNAFLAERGLRGPLHALGESLSPEAGLEVEFKVLTLGKLERSAPSMFYYDLVAGHRWLLGDDALLSQCEPHRDPGAIPLHEATRLLFNRCSGLLFALERLQRSNFGSADADFVARNLAKAQLAFGDVWLTSSGAYHWSCRERHARLMKCSVDGSPAWLPALLGHHTDGVEFKLHPTRSVESGETLRGRHAGLSELGRNLWLWLESRRLARPQVSAREYALSGANKCPETSRLRNRLVNFRAFGASGLADDRYPRERLLHALTLLLWEPRVLQDQVLIEGVQRQLRTTATDLSGLVSAYQRLWGRFN